MSDPVLRIVTYHRVMDPRRATGDPSLISATPAVFERQMRHLARHFHVVSAEEAAAAWTGGPRLPRRSVLVTFDDATRDFAEVAWPIMRRFNLPATIFVPTAFAANPQRTFWWDRLYDAVVRMPLPFLDLGSDGTITLPATDAERRQTAKTLQQRIKQMPHGDAMALVDHVCEQVVDVRVLGQSLTWPDLRALAAQGVSLGAHTHTHPALTRVDLDRARDEIRQSREEIARHTGTWPVAFAYPFGDHNQAIAKLVRNEGFAFAVTCLDGENDLRVNPMRLRRINITRRTSPMLFAARLTRAGIRADRWRHRAPGTAEPVQCESAGPVKLAYVMSRFPKLSETFVLNEIAAVSNLGVPVEIYPLLRERQATAHPEAERWAARARYVSWLSPRLLRAHVQHLATQPVTYLMLLVEVLRRTWGSPNLFVGALGTFPKAVQFADDARRRGVTHVHAHFATHPALAAFVVQRLTGIPYSFTAHGSDLHVDRTMLDAKVQSAAFVVAISRFNKEIIVRECGEQVRSKVHVVHCGVDPGTFAAPGERGGDTCRIVCVASLEEVKGHRFLIEACARLRDRGVNFVCDLIGDGPLRSVLAQQIAAAGLDRYVRLLGAKARPDVVKHLESAHVAVLASHPTASGKREGIPVALMEAMAAELPVVSTAISGIPELVRSGVSGILVPSGDAEALAGALERLAADPDERTRMGREGRIAVLREFDLHANAQTLLTLCTGEAVAP